MSGWITLGLADGEDIVVWAPPAGQEPCRVYWGSHGCNLQRGHDGEHRCDDGCPPIDDYEAVFGEDWQP